MGGVLLTVRDPWEWYQARVRGYDWAHLPTACGCEADGCIYLRDAPIIEAPMSFFVYQAWAACVATSPALGLGEDSLLAMNLFAQLPQDLEVCWPQRRVACSLLQP